MRLEGHVTILNKIAENEKNSKPTQKIGTRLLI